jgi:hypothetical protein
MKFLATKFASPSRTRIAQLRRQLQTVQQGSKSCAKYVNFAKLLAHQLSTVGKAIDDDELITYILDGLNPSFNPFVVSLSLATRDSSLTVEDFNTELQSIEQLIENQHQSIGTDTSVALLSHKPSSHSFPRKLALFHSPILPAASMHQPRLLHGPLYHDNSPPEIPPISNPLPLSGILPAKYVVRRVTMH